MFILIIIMFFFGTRFLLNEQKHHMQTEEFIQIIQSDDNNQHYKTRELEIINKFNNRINAKKEEFIKRLEAIIYDDLTDDDKIFYNKIVKKYNI